MCKLPWHGGHSSRNHRHSLQVRCKIYHWKKDQRAHGYEVLSIDIVRSPGGGFISAQGYINSIFVSRSVCCASTSTDFFVCFDLLSSTYSLIANSCMF